MPEHTARSDHAEWAFHILLFGWHLDGPHPDPVMQFIESGGRFSDGVFDLRERDTRDTHLYRDGREVPLPGWWHLLPAVIGGLDPYAEPAHA